MMEKSALCAREVVMQTILFVNAVVSGVVAVCLLFVLVREVHSHRGKEESASVSEQKREAGFSRKTAKRTLREAYGALSAADRARFDAVAEAAELLELSTRREGKYSYNVMQGRDVIARLTVVKGVVTLDCILVNVELKKYGKTQGLRMKGRPMRFRIVDDKTLDAALFTMKIVNRTALEARGRLPKRTETEGAAGGEG